MFSIDDFARRTLSERELWQMEQLSVLADRFVVSPDDPEMGMLCGLVGMWRSSDHDRMREIVESVTPDLPVLSGVKDRGPVLPVRSLGSVHLVPPQIVEGRRAGPSSDTEYLVGWWLDVAMLSFSLSGPSLIWSLSSDAEWDAVADWPTGQLLKPIWSPRTVCGREWGSVVNRESADILVAADDVASKKGMCAVCVGRRPAPRPKRTGDPVPVAKLLGL
jgi:hypothetical protein